ncbi:MAG: phage tail family protein [Bacillota bacterium]
MKTLNNFKIQLENGTMYDMYDDFGIIVRSIQIPSPTPIINYERIDGRHGDIRVGKEFGARPIKASCSLFAFDTIDYPLLRNELYKLFMAHEQMYLIIDAEPKKRWKVDVTSSFLPDRLGTYGTFDIQFNAPMGMSESIGTTLDAFTFESGVWQVGSGVSLSENDYTHETNTFNIYNASDEIINPRFIPLRIEFKGSSSSLSITNNTTGDNWRYNGSSASGDTILIDGVRSIKNGLNIFGSTNKKLVSLAPGNNSFTLSGTVSPFTISFEFRYYLL